MINASVSAVRSSSSSRGDDEWEITVQRYWLHQSPNAADLPPDIRAALLDWLGIPAGDRL